MIFFYKAYLIIYLVIKILNCVVVQFPRLWLACWIARNYLITAFCAACKLVDFVNEIVIHLENDYIMDLYFVLIRPEHNVGNLKFIENTYDNQLLY